MRICNSWKFDGRERGGKGIAEADESWSEQLLKKFLRCWGGIGVLIVWLGGFYFVDFIAEMAGFFSAKRISHGLAERSVL
jgi:hypothetical protein